MEAISQSISPRWRFDLTIAGLGVVYLALALATSEVIERYAVGSSFALTALTLLATSPILIAFILLGRRRKALANDEYLQQLFITQLLFTSVWSVGMACFFAFYHAHSPDFSGGMPFFVPGLCWFAMWPMAALLARP